MTQPQPRLTLRAVRARAVEVPMTYVLGTSAAAVRAAPLLLVDVETEEGITGRTYLFCYTRAAAAPIAAMLVDAAAALAASRLDLGDDRAGSIGMAGAVARATKIVDHHPRPASRKFQRIGASDAAAGTGHDCNLSSEVDCHGNVSLRQRRWHGAPLCSMARAGLRDGRLIAIGLRMATRDRRARR